MTSLPILVISYRSILIFSFDETFSLIDLRITIFSTFYRIAAKDHRCSFILEKSNSNLILKCVYICIIRYNYTILTSVSTSHIGEVGSGKEGRKGMRFSRDPPQKIIKKRGTGRFIKFEAANMVN